jgi:uncharacterized repeat protein (TIGR03803 family)
MLQVQARRAPQRVWLAGTLAVAAGAFALCAWPGAASAASTYKVIRPFCAQAQCTDGKNPQSPLITDAAGNVYGVTLYGGLQNSGTIFELVPNQAKTAYSYRRLHSFCSRPGCADGSYPYTALILDSHGNLYGTTASGGTAGVGVVFEMVVSSVAPAFKVLHTFCATAKCGDGWNPMSGLTYQGASSGAPYDGISPLYGTVLGGAAHGYGAAYQLAPDAGTARWIFRPVHNFCALPACADGSNPQMDLTMDQAGNLYGATSAGGSTGKGTIFRLSPAGGAWRETVLKNVCIRTNCSDGQSASTPMILDAAGNLIGTMYGGGTHSGGVIFKLDPATKSYSVLYQFCAQANCADGGQPDGSIVLDAGGNVYGTTNYHGLSNRTDAGVIWRLSGTSYQALYAFCTQADCPDGNSPFSGLAMAADGSLFGAASQGAANASGGVFRLVP